LKTQQIWQVFLAITHIPKENRRKLHSKSIKCLLLGINSETKAYVVFDRTRQKVVISRNIVFDKNLVGYHHLDPTDSTLSPLIFPKPNTIDPLSPDSLGPKIVSKPPSYPTQTQIPRHWAYPSTGI